MNLILCFEKSADNGEGTLIEALWRRFSSGGMMLKRIVFVFFVFFTVFGVEASMISFVVVETGLPQEGERNQHSLYLENVLLDVFFDEGHIVSNAPILRLETKPLGGILQSPSFFTIEEEALNGGFDYIVLAQIDYLDSQTPGDMSFFVYRIRGRVKVLERQIRGKPYRTARDEIDDLKIIVRELVPYLN